MATQAEIKDAILDYGLVETLFAGVVNDSLESSEGLLGALRDVDVRGPKQRTLLHLAVRAGRVDWVQRLLGMGADPGLRDADGHTVADVDVRDPRQRTLLHLAVRAGRVDWVQGLLGMGADPGLRDADGHTVADVAEHVVTWFPEEEDRPRIREMVLGKLGQDGAARGAATGGSSPPDACGETEVTKGIKDLITTVTRLSDEVTSFKNGACSETGKLDNLSMEMTSLQSTVLQHFESAYAAIASILKDNVNALRAEVKLQIERQLGLEDAVKEVRKGMDTSSNEIGNVKLSLTSFVEEWGPWKEQAKEELRRLKSDSEGLKLSNSRILRSVDEIEKVRARVNCIAAMMAMTDILDSNDGSISKVRKVYERLYSGSQLTSHLLTFLQFQPEVKIRIDCSSSDIGRLKETFTDHDGVERIGSDSFLFADLEEKTAYVGGWNRSEEKVFGLLAWVLSQLAVSLAFKNGGRPYREGDEDGGREMGRVVQAAEEKMERKSGGGLYFFLRVALEKKSQLAREIYLISAVPAIIARYRSTKGTSMLTDQQLTTLLTFYTNHVLPALSE